MQSTVDTELVLILDNFCDTFYNKNQLKLQYTCNIVMQ